MRYPNPPKFRINQLVHVSFCPKPGIIKGFRFCGMQIDYGRRFVSEGYEYQIFIAISHPNNLSEWGWMREDELEDLKTLNELGNWLNLS